MAGDLRSNRNELIKLVSDFWAQAPTLVELPGPYAKLVVADIDNDNNPDADVNPGAGGNTRPFARMRIQHTQSAATSISGRRYRNNGSLTVNLYVPRQRSDAWWRSGELAAALVYALRSHRGNVYLIGVTPRERPINNGFNQIDVVSDFYWDQSVKIGA